MKENRIVIGRGNFPFHIDYSTEKRRYIISLVTIFVVSVLQYLWIPIRFETNDDSAIMYMVAGYLLGTPFEGTIYTNVIYGYILREAYTISPNIAWYTIFHLLFIFVSCCFILKSLLKICRKNDRPIWMPLGLYFVFHMLAIIYPSIMLQFTTTPAVLGTAASMTIFTLYEGESVEERKKERGI